MPRLDGSGGRTSVARAKQQAERKVVSQAEVERVEGESIEADATVKVAESAVASCALNLEFTEVTAPFAGTISGHVLGPGNVAVADTTRLATIMSMDSVSVAFDVDQRTILSLNRLKLQKGPRRQPAETGETAERAIADNRSARANRGPGLPWRWACPTKKGFRTAAQSSPWTSRSIRRRALLPGASIPNADGLLLPGMFVRVRLVISPPYKGLLVPDYAVIRHDGRASVFVVTDQNIVQRRPVRTIGALQDGGLRSVEGIKADEWVVIAHEPSPPVSRWDLGLRGSQTARGFSQRRYRFRSNPPPSPKPEGSSSMQDAGEGVSSRPSLPTAYCGGTRNA